MRTEERLQKGRIRNLAKGIHGLIERTDISDKLFYVLQTETSYPYLQEHIQNFPGKPGVDRRKPVPKNSC